MDKDRHPENPTVYSTEWGRICPECGKPVGNCTCKSGKEIPRGDGTVRVGLHVKGRGGKKVTVISGIQASGDAFSKLGRELKQLCGSGGTVKDGIVEIQGDFRDRIVLELKRRGFTVKKSGG